MKVFLDNEMINIFSHDPLKIIKNPLIADPQNQIDFRWPSLLNYLGLRDLFKQLPAFDEEQPIFQVYLSALCANDKEEALLYLYDSLFAECLTQIKALPQINAPFFLEAIQTERQKKSFLAVEASLSSVLAFYEEAFKERPSQMMHDLILYLAWDRMCVYISRLFDYQSADVNLIRGLEVLKHCLIESYQHITKEAKTSPSFYRLAEALFFYFMREENLQKHQEKEWALLSQGFSVFKPQDELGDVLYIDNAVISKGVIPDETIDCYLTLNTSETVNIRQSFAKTIMDKLSFEIPEWGYTLHKKQMVYVEPK